MQQYIPEYSQNTRVELNPVNFVQIQRNSKIKFNAIQPKKYGTYLTNYDKAQKNGLKYNEM